MHSSGSEQGPVADSCVNLQDFSSILAITNFSRTQFHVDNYIKIWYLIFVILFNKMNMQEGYYCDVHIKVHQLLCCFDLWICRFFANLRHVWHLWSICFYFREQTFLMIPSCCFSRLKYKIGHNVSMTHTGMKFVNHRRGRQTAVPDYETLQSALFCCLVASYCGRTYGKHICNQTVGWQEKLICSGMRNSYVTRSFLIYRSWFTYNYSFLSIKDINKVRKTEKRK